MAASSFGAALARVLRHEGGFSDHPADPGGPTQTGVTQRVYDGYRARKNLPPRSVRLLEEAELVDIYRRHYWDAVRADDLPVGLDYAVFDAAVNSGPAQAAKWLQRAAGVVADGQVGTLTLAAVTAGDPARLAADLCDRRLAMLRTLRTWPVFGRGWGRRVAEVRRVSVALASGTSLAEPEMPVFTATPAGKAPPSDLSLAAVARSPEALAGGLAVLGALANGAAQPGPLQWAVALAVLAAVAAAAVAFVRRRREA
ncbi:glycoside hydrolase family 108 protein [Aquabacter cavernae]|uniref:glycoside hydrolase family 108 protein n=1 Tax=Aquabacter cavernae TaxID=2496029 RepID=UPI000F8E3897|nr:glycosyl hydrolase 108 family protein [Aquabacter cavernae]